MPQDCNMTLWPTITTDMAINITQTAIRQAGLSRVLAIEMEEEQRRCSPPRTEASALFFDDERHILCRVKALGSQPRACVVRFLYTTSDGQSTDDVYTAGGSAGKLIDDAG